MPFPNITLHVPGGASMLVYLPGGFYNSSRFDWGSMIGDIHYEGRVVFGGALWRAPHNVSWTESGIGLASEFGCGEDGAHCPSGWGDYPPDSTNGVLGYDEARAGEPFLKIGVGALVKGSCDQCNIMLDADPYRFNSPYRFYERPEWKVHQDSARSITLEHSATLQQQGRGRRLGYSVRRTVSLSREARIRVETRLRNTGSGNFSTPWYSHNFLSVDNRPAPVGVKLFMDVNVREYTDCLPWAKPLNEYFSVDGQFFWTTKPVEEKTRIKAVFHSAADESIGFFAASWPGGPTVVKRTIGPLPLLAYNLYAEMGTLSPEPVYMLQLGAGESTSIVEEVDITVAAQPDACAASCAQGIAARQKAHDRVRSAESTLAVSGRARVETRRVSQLKPTLRSFPSFSAP
eukprot:5633283-Pleurochrysis_carterae.AAC.1